LILIAGFSLLYAGGKHLIGLDVGDRDAGPADLSAQDHSAVRDDTHENPRGFRIIQMWIWGRFIFGWNGGAWQRKHKSQNEC
jgi:hypothetical protein